MPRPCRNPALAERNAAEKGRHDKLNKSLKTLFALYGIPEHFFEEESLEIVVERLEAEKVKLKQQEDVFIATMERLVLEGQWLVRNFDKLSEEDQKKVMSNPLLVSIVKNRVSPPTVQADPLFIETPSPPSLSGDHLAPEYSQPSQECKPVPPQDTQQSQNALEMPWGYGFGQFSHNEALVSQNDFVPNIRKRTLSCATVYDQPPGSVYSDYSNYDSVCSSNQSSPSIDGIFKEDKPLPPSFFPSPPPSKSSCCTEPPAKRWNYPDLD